MSVKNKNTSVQTESNIHYAEITQGSG
jgi:hypothetical protein